MKDKTQLHLGDCLDVLPTLNENSIDMILVDLPYQMTAQSWDTLIPFAPMWENIKRVLKPNRAGAFFASQPFTSTLTVSNYEQFRHDWVWEKGRATGHLNKSRRPMKAHEDILVFSQGEPLYNPQMTHGHTRKRSTTNGQSRRVYGGYAGSRYDSTSRYPRSVLKFSTVAHKDRVHPNQKPIKLLAYLIRTYTNEGDTVLDFTMGSGSTGVACGRTGRNFVGIELNESFYSIAVNRVENAYGEFSPTPAERRTRQVSLFNLI